ncbi:BNR-4 repeat-containing protein [Cerasicoccus maritimus]|uniref:BNR-4 repeat-containing protein n=1 Tax=Cerasicoccus maritimus TaxID=490089 RepID=UPI0028528591|nr:BNR-4 repeat-containing protein [Cerasicoccus maritimus]
MEINQKRQGSHQPSPSAQPSGYHGIWFDLGQRNEYGSKYSGGLATYTMKHRPLAVYCRNANKTFFVYGGTRAPNERHLLCMIGAYDHDSRQLLTPKVVHDKDGVDDPHDNPSISLDESGHIWVFISGRGAGGRLGQIYRSTIPESIDDFEHIHTSEFTYPQPWWIEGKGFLHLYTMYTGLRELYFSTSRNGREWTPPTKLAGIGGHYQISEQRGSRIATAFNRHPGGDCDLRTDLYYIESHDFGATWQTVDGKNIELPITAEDHPSRIKNFSAEGRLVYVKDINFDHLGNPIILCLTSAHCHAGPKGDPRQWEIAHWDGEEWQFNLITQSSHNYDSGSLYVEGQLWRVIGPTEAGPQHWGQGGEIAVWESIFPGNSWVKTAQLTQNSVHNQSYVRRPSNSNEDFYAFWCSGNTDSFSQVDLYFTDRNFQNISKMP